MTIPDWLQHEHPEVGAWAGAQLDDARERISSVQKRIDETKEKLAKYEEEQRFLQNRANQYEAVLRNHPDTRAPSKASDGSDGPNLPLTG